MFKYRKRFSQQINGPLFLLILLIVFFSNDTTLFGSNMNTSFVSWGFIAEAVLLLAVVVAFYIHNNCKIAFHTRPLALLALLVWSISMTVIVNRDCRGGYAIVVFMSCLGFFMTQAIPRRAFAEAYTEVMKFYAACSIFGRIITDLFPAIRHAGFIVKRSTGQVFHHFILYARSIEDIGGRRNYSIFREPGVFQIYLIIAIIISIALLDGKKEKRDLWGVLILVVAVLLTQSTTGYMSLAFVGFFFFIRERRSQNRTIKPVVIVAETALLGACACISIVWLEQLLEIFYHVALEKFDSSSPKFISSITRIASFGANLKIWFLNPVFGVGITKKDLIYNNLVYSMYGYRVDSDTNTILSGLSQFGIVIGAIDFFGIIGFSRCSGKINLERIVIFLIAAFLLSSEYLVFSALFNVLLWYGVSVLFPVSQKC